MAAMRRPESYSAPYLPASFPSSKKREVSRRSMASRSSGRGFEKTGRGKEGLSGGAQKSTVSMSNFGLLTNQ